MNILIAPDSFKGSLSALQAGNIIKNAFIEVIPDANLDVVPMADGGEGTLDTLLFVTGGKRLHLEVTGPLQKKVGVEFGILGDNKTIVIEIAKIAGLPMVAVDQQNPLETTTYGIGEVIKACCEKGYRDFIIGLGGSATNDGGLGMLQALGVSFLDKNKQPVLPIGRSVSQIEHVDFSTIQPDIKECKIQIASDVDNPLCGDNGATAVFGPQKGATPDMVEKLDRALSKYATLIENHLNKTYQFNKGAGAAGGLGFAFLLLGAEITSGAKLMAESTKLVDKIKAANWVITGEGQSDFQTLFGKVPGYIGKIAEVNNVKALLLSGSLGKGYEELYQYFISCDSIANGPISLQHCMEHAEDLLFKKAYNLARLLKGLDEKDKKILEGSVSR
ncbi:glycerate kinase [Bacillus sp. Marseille-P3661]|uniref:glycerate kinase n=1 Tax=Bacillus sp. Marseille-P3661 TaxID=1936234 RepID=UPI000C855BD5|nr:glycerate kinase [Bacillus sp. Marseille-P3661]